MQSRAPPELPPKILARSTSSFHSEASVELAQDCAKMHLDKRTPFIRALA
jgi:hypothetical protein